MAYLCKMTPFATSVICNFCWMFLANVTIIPTKETAADVWFSDDLSLLVMYMFLYYNLKRLLLLLLHKSLVAVQSIILNPFQSSCRIERRCKIKCFAFNNTWQMVLDISSLIKALCIESSYIFFQYWQPCNYSLHSDALVPADVHSMTPSTVVERFLMPCMHLIFRHYKPILQRIYHIISFIIRNILKE